MSHSWRISRRTVLRGLGTAVALPMLDAMLPEWASAEEVRKNSPRRMAFLYVPNGANMQEWTPQVEGTDYELTYILEPLAPHKQQLNVMSNLTQDRSRPHGDGGGDHARALATFLTGCQAKKTHGADIKVGPSVDQVAAQKVGSQTRFASLELGCDAGAQSGNCDSGYSCAYSTNIAWRTESTPVAKENNPRLVFERLFGAGSEGDSGQAQARRQRHRKSVLDFVLEDANSLRGKVGTKDQRKLDEYLSSVRELETRINRVESENQQTPSIAKPSGVPQNYADHIRLLGDLMVLAFQADLTRISTFVLADEGSNRNYPFIDVPDGHHNLSHHGRDKAKLAKIRDINRFHVTQFAYILDKLKGVKEGERTLLDNSMVVYGSGISDGDRHNHDNLPILLAGSGGGTIKPGRHLRYAGQTPLCNLYLSMLDRMDSSTDHLGDSKGRLEWLEG